MNAETRDSHGRALKALADILYKAQGVECAETGKAVDVGGEVVLLRRILDASREPRRKLRGIEIIEKGVKQ